MKRLLLTLMLAATVLSVSAQRRADSLIEYRRSSIYSVLIKHSQMPYSSTIDSAFMWMPLPDKFNDHSLPMHAFESSVTKPKVKAKSKQKDAANLADIEKFLTENAVAKQMVAKWYNRDPYTGICNRDLIGERGFYDASQQDIDLADETFAGREQLGDRGEELIGNTFVLINDITFADQGERSAKAATGIAIIGGLFGALLGSDAITDGAMTVAAAVNEIDGFILNVTSYLYRLDWDKEHREKFESNYYVSSRMDEATRQERAAAFDAIDGTDSLFRLSYIGCTTAQGRITTSKSFSLVNKVDQMLIACARGIDKSIVNLQRAYEEFQVNVPIYQINEDGTVDVKIGLKEGVNAKSTYDVIREEWDAEGNITYKKIGSIAPVKDKIWDNRMGALEEAEALKADGVENKDEEAKEGNVYLTATTFKVKTGNVKDFVGCLVREERIK